MKANEIITDGLGYAFMIEKVIDFKNNSFSVTYRTWSTKNECGGYQTTILVKGLPINCYKFFVLANKFEVKGVEQMTGGKVTSFKTNQVVSDRFSYRNIKHLLN